MLALPAGVVLSVVWARAVVFAVAEQRATFYAATANATPWEVVVGGELAARDEVYGSLIFNLCCN